LQVQFTPSPVEFGPQVQERVPTPVVRQLAPGAQPPLLVAHTSSMAHTAPFAVVPAMQVQV
jgi:hypothetical protein